MVVKKIFHTQHMIYPKHIFHIIIFFVVNCQQTPRVNEFFLILTTFFSVKLSLPIFVNDIHIMDLIIKTFCQNDFTKKYMKIQANSLWSNFFIIHYTYYTYTTKLRK